MSDNIPSLPSNRRDRKLLSVRRLVLLTSAACIGIGVLGVGPVIYKHLDSGYAIGTALAAESAQPPASFADLVARVKPAVISVHVTIQESANSAGAGQDDNVLPLEPGSPLERFFRQFGFPEQNGVPQSRQIITGEGSGFFISPDGYAVTNNHVVDHAKTVQVTTDNGRKLSAKVVGVDPKTDLAVIKVDGSAFPFVKFADHEPRIGDWVVAVGNPFGLGGTVTAGIVSARGRDIGSSPYDDFIQIDAPINKGNSGGPTFDLSGNVVGVNTAIYSPSGGSVGIGFDIPATTAKEVVAQLETKGVVTRGWIGVQIQPVTQDIADSLGLKAARGALVDEPQPNSPAAKAGIKSGDVITGIDGTAVKDSRDLAKRVGAMAPGTSVKLSILRNGEARMLTLTLGQLPKERQAQNRSLSDQSAATGVPRLGLSLAPAANVAGAGSQGVVVIAVAPDGPASERGIQTGDIILDVGGKAVSTPADVRKDLAALQQAGKRFALMRLKSGDSTKFVAMPVGRA
jgi:serine protease Do